MNKVIADSGSTKTDWLFSNGRRVRTQGINPVHQSDDDIEAVLRGQFLSLAGGGIDSVTFYGAGCTGGHAERVHRVIASVLRISRESVTVGTDLLCAARALFGSGEGIACILGTGSNSCLYIQGEIKANIPPLGYILGDEGSGAVLGSLFLNALYKGRLRKETSERFAAWSGLAYEEIINKVYHEPAANRFLASLSPFVAENMDADKSLQTIVDDNFRAFFHNNVNRYNRRGMLNVGFVGSIAWHYRDRLSAIAHEEGYSVSGILRSPLDGFIEFPQ